MYKIKELHEGVSYYDPQTGKSTAPNYTEKVDKNFVNKSDAIDAFLEMRKRRDFCDGYNYVHFPPSKDNGKYGSICIYEFDEDGTSVYQLFKWKNFDQEVQFKYTVFEGDDENAVVKEMNYKELADYAEENNAYVFWDDDSYGHRGWLCEKGDDGRLITNIYIECEVHTSFPCRNADVHPEIEKDEENLDRTSALEFDDDELPIWDAPKK